MAFSHRIIVLTCVSSVLALGACAGTELVEVRAEPKGANCPAGGNAVLAGVDRNHNGNLDPSEVSSVQYICNGTDGVAGVNTLTREAPEGPGSNCEFGGVQLSSGLDTNGDGELSESETTQTSYVCHGAPGATGAAGHSTLVAVTKEAPGDNCAAGGARVDSGLDLDSDGVLSSAEVTTSSYVCSGVAGPAGPSGATGSVLQRLSWAPSACDSGGVRIDFGLDTDESGVLDDSEITGTSYLCNTVLPWSHGGIAVGDSFACTPSSNGSVACWGNNANGQLGDGSLLSQPSPHSLVSGLVSVTSIAAGGSRGCAITGSSVQCWGQAPLGDATSNSSAIPVTVRRTGGGHPPSSTVPFDGAVALSLGESHSCALRADSTVWCWGDNSAGQLGHIPASGSDLRAQAVTIIPPGGTLTTLTGAVAIASGNKHSCALLSSGQMYCWGSQAEGQLGNDTIPAFPSAVLVRTTSTGSDADAALSNVVSIDAGGDHTCAGLKDGTVRCWGSNASGELGTGDTVPLHFASLAVTGISNARALASGLAHSCALLSDASVRCWGANDAGQLGNGSLLGSLVPLPVATSNLVTSLDAGPRGETTCARLIDGRALCWGAGSDGQLGNGLPAQDSPLPVVVTSIH